MFVDILEYVWKDNDTGRLNKVITLEPRGKEDVVIVWYKDLGTGELHCMSESIFVFKHTAKGLYKRKEITNG